MTHSQLAIQFFLQIAVILAACQLVGWAARYVRQPQVVAEMIAGVLLGPSLLGLLAPEISGRLFPAESMKVLFPISQLGLAAYMFVVGLEFRVDIVRQRFGSAALVSIAGMAAPFALGGLLGWYFHRHTQLFPVRTTVSEAVIFMGASMCITAFPMLARIIHFKGLSGTTMGTVALGAGAIDDAAAWCLLALVLASFDGDTARAFANIAAGLGYVGVTLLLIRPLLARWAVRYERAGTLSDGGFVVCLTLMALGAWFTELIGLHPVFGAFIMGTAMPRGVVSNSLIHRIHPFTVGLLLPTFFTFSGLNTQIGLLDSVYLWGMAGLVLVAAVAGKGVACWLASRAAGLPQREALGIGTLMNARGLMELIIINIGLQRGIISPSLFATLVIMAVLTTLMASPIFDWLVGNRSASPEDSAGLASDVPVDDPTSEMAQRRV